MRLTRTNTGARQRIKRRPFRSDAVDKWTFFGEKGNNYFDKKRKRIAEGKRDRSLIVW